MRLRFFSWLATVALLAAAVTAGLPTSGSAARRAVSSGVAARWHVHLLKSEPAANDTVAGPNAVRLWFSEEVELKVTRVKLTAATGSAVPLGAPSRAKAEPNAPVAVAIAKTLVPGTYTVSWSTAAMDGHPTKGTIEFAVKSAR